MTLKKGKPTLSSGDREEPVYVAGFMWSESLGRFCPTVRFSTGYPRFKGHLKMKKPLK